MPKLNKTYTLEITPEQFLDACSGLELQEVEMLMFSERYKKKIREASETKKIEADSERK